MAWVEPTRRLTFPPRIRYEGRYGASLTALVLGGYLLVSTNVAQLAIGLGGISSFRADQMAFFAIQFVTAVAVIVFALAVAPATSGRRIIAIVVVLVLLLVWLILFTARMTGNPGPLPFAMAFVTPQSFIVPLVTVLGWFIVRERPPLSYLVLLLSIVGGAIPFLLVYAAAPAVFSQLTVVPVAAIVGVGMAWLGRAIAGAIQRSHLADAYVDPPLAA